MGLFGGIVDSLFGGGDSGGSRQETVVKSTQNQDIDLTVDNEIAVTPVLQNLTQITNKINTEPLEKLLSHESDQSQRLMARLAEGQKAESAAATQQAVAAQQTAIAQTAIAQEEQERTDILQSRLSDIENWMQRSGKKMARYAAPIGVAAFGIWWMVRDGER